MPKPAKDGAAHRPIRGPFAGNCGADVKTLLGRPRTLPSSIRYDLGSLYAQQQIAFAGLAKMFAAALVAELVLLLFL